MRQREILARARYALLFYYKLWLKILVSFVFFEVPGQQCKRQRRVRRERARWGGGVLIF